jgi:hypothetical protein
MTVLMHRESARRRDEFSMMTLALMSSSMARRAAFLSKRSLLHTQAHPSCQSKLSTISFNVHNMGDVLIIYAYLCSKAVPPGPAGCGRDVAGRIFWHLVFYNTDQKECKVFPCSREYTFAITFFLQTNSTKGAHVRCDNGVLIVWPVAHRLQRIHRGEQWAWNPGMRTLFSFSFCEQYKR